MKRTHNPSVLLGFHWEHTPQQQSFHLHAPNIHKTWPNSNVPPVPVFESHSGIPLPNAYHIHSAKKGKKVLVKDLCHTFVDLNGKPHKFVLDPENGIILNNFHRTFLARFTATKVPSSSLPLKTVPNPPCPILKVGEKFLVALTISSMLNFTLPGSRSCVELFALA